MKANPAPGKVKNPVFPSAKPKVLTGAEATTVLAGAKVLTGAEATTVLVGAKVLTGACAKWWTGAATVRVAKVKGVSEWVKTEWE